MLGWEKKITHLPCSIRPIKIGPTIYLLICRRTRVWTVFAPTRALLNSGGESDYQSDVITDYSGEERRVVSLAI